MSSKRILAGAALLVALGLLLGCAVPVTGTPQPLLPSLTPTAPEAIESPTSAIGAAETATPFTAASPTAAVGGGPGPVRTTLTPGATPCTVTPNN